MDRRQELIMTGWVIAVFVAAGCWVAYPWWAGAGVLVFYGLTVFLMRFEE